MESPSSVVLLTVIRSVGRSVVVIDVVCPLSTGRCLYSMSSHSVHLWHLWTSVRLAGYTYAIRRMVAFIHYYKISLGGGLFAPK